MNIYTCRQAIAENFIGNPNMHVISIRTVGDKPAALDTAWGHITFVEINDDNSIPSDRVIVEICTGVLLAKMQKADMLIHCQLGVSRSVAVARAIASIVKDARYVTNPPFRGNIVVDFAVRQGLLATLPENMCNG